MKEWILQHLASIILAVIFIVVILVLWFAWRGKYRDKAKQMLLSLVIAAEEKFGGGTGEVKFSAVADALYDKLPPAAKFLISEKTIASLIEGAVTKMKEYLSAEG